MSTYNRGWIQGNYRLKNPEKYIGKKAPMYRSSWEADLFNMLDNNINVKKWCSENVVIPYVSIDGKTHRYITDAYVEIINKMGELEIFLIEVKPRGQGPIPNGSKPIKLPKMPKRKTQKSMRRYIMEMNTYKKNTLKWKAATEYCRRKGWKFLILTTEDFVNSK